MTLNFDPEHCFNIYLPLRVPFCLQMWNFSSIGLIISIYAMFDNAFGPQTHLSAHSGKNVSRSSNLIAPVQKTIQCSTFWFLFELSTINIKDLTCPRNIVNFRHSFDLWPWPLTFTGNVSINYQWRFHLLSTATVWWPYLKKWGKKPFFANSPNSRARRLRPVWNIENIESSKWTQ